MKFYILIFLIISNILTLKGQKPVIDSTSYNKWPVVSTPILSNNGRYTSYCIGNEIPDKIERLVFQSTQTSWKWEYQNVKGMGAFTASSKYGLFITSKDSLCVVNLEDKTIQMIPDVMSFKVPFGGRSDWVLFYKANKPNTAVLKNFTTGKEIDFACNQQSCFSDDGKLLIINELQHGSKKRGSVLELVNLTNTKITVIMRGSEFSDLTYDFKHKQMAFKVQDSIWYFDMTEKNAVFLCNPKSYRKDQTISSDYLRKFSKDGKYLYFNVNKYDGSFPTADIDAVSVWSYRDVKIQTVQENDLKEYRGPSFLSSIRLSDHKIIQIEKHKSENIDIDGINEFALSCYQIDSGLNEKWRSEYCWKCEVIETKTGNRRSLDFLPKEAYKSITISPSGRYIVYFDKSKGQYVSYNLYSDKRINLTKTLSVSWSENIESDYSSSGPRNRGFAGWVEGENSLLIYDTHDIWMIDAEGKMPPTNITNGYGIKNNIIFNLTYKEQAIIKNKVLLLTAFNQANKNNGFFSIKLTDIKGPEKLTMGPYIYDLKETPYVQVRGLTEYVPVKARDTDVYLIRRMSATEAPNYFVTRDFKSYSTLTDLNFQKKYNWYTTELHTWNSLTGRKLQGILYKPENFDPKKKYPIIFHYYERKSDGLNAFLYPQYSGGSIDIPTYVSNGYLVFSPDIFYTVGDPMQGTYDAVISAARYLSTLIYVDPAKMGLQGYSFGGVQTNYLVTHSSLFAAACSAAGLSDLISNYGSAYGYSNTNLRQSQQDSFEDGQLRMGTTLWENLAGYINNSSIFQVHTVTTPLLMEHGMKDGACQLTNVLEFFLGLRRMGKKAWLLTYPNSGHGLVNKDSKDFSIRMQQFFDHYLKGEQAPVWMTQGIPASRRGIENGLELDKTIDTPGSGLLSVREQNKVDSLMIKKPSIITLR